MYDFLLVIKTNLLPYLAPFLRYRYTSKIAIAYLATPLTVFVLEVLRFLRRRLFHYWNAFLLDLSMSILCHRISHIINWSISLEFIIRTFCI